MAQEVRLLVRNLDPGGCIAWQVAIDESNAKGGVLGKQVQLLVRDDESNPKPPKALMPVVCAWSNANGK